MVPADSLERVSWKRKEKGESDHGGMCTDRHRTEAEHESGFCLRLHKIHRIPGESVYCGGWHGRTSGGGFCFQLCGGKSGPFF